MKTDITNRELGKYDGGDSVATQITILLLEARNNNKSIDSVIELIDESRKRWEKERAIWQERHDHPENWSGYAQQPIISVTRN
jgi:hypothetical protein